MVERNWGRQTLARIFIIFKNILFNILSIIKNKKNLYLVKM